MVPYLASSLNFTLYICFCLLIAAAMSVEEDRLWNIVRANSLDFNTWTALIEETEKVAAEVCWP